MQFKVVGKSLILTDYSHKITEGEGSFDTVEITVPKKHDDCDLSMLDFRFSETSEDGENSAVQVLHHTKCDEKYIYLKGTITSDFSAITGKVKFMLTGINDKNVVAKFQSTPFTVSDDISLASLPNKTTAEQLFNQTHLETVKAIEAAERAERASQTPAPAEIYPASCERLGGVLSGNDISVSDNGTVTVNSVNGKTLGKSVPENAVFTDTVYTLPKATANDLGGVKVDGQTLGVTENGVIYAKNIQQTPIYYSTVSEKGWYRFCVIPAPRTTNNCLIGISREFNHRSPEVYQISLTSAYKSCVMKVLNSAVGTQLVTKIRVLMASVQPESHDTYLELFYDFNEENPFIIGVTSFASGGKSPDIKTIPLVKSENIPENYTATELNLST